MKILGLIMENNPFHKGHQYYIQEAIKKVQPDYTIVITSGNFTMRGEVSILNKFDKTNILLQNNVDFVFELPFMLANHSADFFAYNSVKILNDLQITDLAFGCEEISLEELKSYAKFSEAPEFNEHFQKTFMGNTSYKKHHFDTYKYFFPDANPNLSKPNNTLAIQYIKQLYKINSNIKIHQINRIGDDDLEQNILNSSYPSGTALRKMHNENKDITEYLPKYNYQFVKTKDDAIFNILKYRLLIQKATPSNNLTNEGIENLISKHIQESQTLNELIEKCSGTRYSSSRIRRCILSLILNNQNIPTIISYYRLLGFNENKQDYLKILKQKNIKVFSSLKTDIDEDTNLLIENEKNAAIFYDLINNTDLYQNEFKLPIKYTGGTYEREN